MIEELFDEARDWVEVVRRLWDSWEDDAEIRDAGTGRFIDIDKLHYIDFDGPRFSVRGPSITPRPPQGQPIVSLLAHQAIPYRLAATSADLVFVTPDNADSARDIVTEIRRETAAAGRSGQRLHVWGDLVVILGDTSTAARARLRRLDDTAGGEYRSDALIFAGTAAELADLLQEWQHVGLSGFRLRPAAIPDDLTRITRSLIPELQRRGAFRTAYGSDTLRGRLGLPRPSNRYAA